MRKISKCFLLIVTLVSLACVLFYKQQYDKLYNVLQVLEFFGNRQGIDNSADPTKFLSCLITSGSVGSAPYRPPAWQRLSGPSDIHIYSAFCARSLDSPDKCSLVKVLAVAPNDFDRNSVSCNLWYEDTLRPVLAIFTAELLAEERKVEAIGGQEKNGADNPNSKMAAFLFSCESKFSSLQPYGVSVSVTGTKGESFAPVEPTFRESDHPGREPETSLAACIRPQSSRVDSSQQILENVLLHQVFGISNFYIYDAGLTTNFIQTLSRIQDIPISVKIMPWNLPSGTIRDQTKHVLVQTDCHLRTRHLDSTTLVLEPYQILTPGSGSILQVLKEPGINGKLEIDISRFCPELESETGPKLIALQQTRYSKKLSSLSKFVVTHQLGPKSQVVSVPRSLMSVYDYGHCNLDELSSEPDDVVVDKTMSSLAHAFETKLGQYFVAKTL